jgi:hypothetical protein
VDATGPRHTLQGLRVDFDQSRRLFTIEERLEEFRRMRKVGHDYDAPVAENESDVSQCMFWFSRTGNAGSRRLRGRLCRVLRGKRTKFLDMVAAIISIDLLEDVLTTLPESPIDFRRATRCCRSPTSPALSVTKKTLAIYLSPFLQRYVWFHLELPAPYFNG